MPTRYPAEMTDGLIEWSLRSGCLKIIAKLDRTVELYLPKGHCTDMSGAIRVAKMFRPEVEQIMVIAGDEPDCTYWRRPESDEWLFKNQR